MDEESKLSEEWTCSICGKVGAYHYVCEGDTAIYRCHECLNEYLGYAKETTRKTSEDSETKVP